MNNLKLFFKGLKKGFNIFGTSIASIINSALLVLAYFLAVGLTFIAAKIVHKSFLETMISKKEKTYWSDLNLKKKPIEEYYRQF